MLKWLQQQANAGVMLVGFCELNNWQDLESYTDLFKNKVKRVFLSHTTFIILHCLFTLGASLLQFR